MVSALLLYRLSHIYKEIKKKVRQAWCTCRRTSNEACLQHNGYHPTASTIAWLAVSLALMFVAYIISVKNDLINRGLSDRPLCAYGQHRFFKYCTFSGASHNDALSFYAHDEDNVDDPGPFIKQHRPMSNRQMISLAIDTKLPKVHAPIRLSFARLAEKEKVTDTLR